jgi:ubiquinone/menaquinone biosynthesis C-methylase UbiE
LAQKYIKGSPGPPAVGLALLVYLLGKELNTNIKFEGTSKKEGVLDSWAWIYDLIMNLSTFGKEYRLRELLIQKICVLPENQIIEIGCGTGTLSIIMKERYGKSISVKGIDAAPKMIKKARSKSNKKNIDIEYSECNINSIPYADKKFDIAICSFMIFHVSEEPRSQGLFEIQRILKDNAKLCLFDFVQEEDLKILKAQIIKAGMRIKTYENIYFNRIYSNLFYMEIEKNN